MKLTQLHFSGIPTEYRREFINIVCRENYSHMMVFAALLVIVEPLLAVFIETPGSDTFFLAFGIALFNLVLLPILRYCKINIEKLKLFCIMAVQTLFVIGMLSGGLLWSLYEQSLFASDSTYMLSIYAVSAFMVMPPPVSAFLFLVFGILFVYLLPDYQLVADMVIILNINIISMSAMAWILNLMSYLGRMKTFLTGKAIIEKNRALEMVNMELRDMTMRDSMTGLLNHKCSIKRLKEEIDRAQRIQYPLSVAMLDLDNFKGINDSFGHQTGDEILIETAKIIEKNCRTTDIVGRYGGEEFIIIMPYTDGKDALMMLERMKAQLGETVYKDGIHITFSCGISELSGEPVHDILKTSDYKLYEAKRKGKNRIEVQLNKKGKSAATN